LGGGTVRITDSSVFKAEVLEEWCRYGGSIESISIERHAFRKKQLLKPLLVVERRLHPEV
jgi:hypothetical protein